MKNYEYHFCVSLCGDPGAIECAIDEIMNVIPTMDLDEVHIHITNVSEVDDD